MPLFLMQTSWLARLFHASEEIWGGYGNAKDDYDLPGNEVVGEYNNLNGDEG
jgi:hypothetical protein